MPSQPKALPDMPPYPALQPVDRSAILSQSVVPPPASYILPPCVPQLFAGSALAASPLLPYLRFESFQALRCRFNLPIAVQSKPQELAFPRPPYPALLGIHLYAFRSIPVCLPHSFSRRLTAYVDIAVIRVPAEPVSSSFQFPIQCVEIDVRQQWRQRPALRRSFHALDHHSLQHRSRPQIFADQLQHPLVSDHLRDLPHQRVPIDVIEELRDI